MFSFQTSVVVYINKKCQKFLPTYFHQNSLPRDKWCGSEQWDLHALQCICIYTCMHVESLFPLFIPKYIKKICSWIWKLNDSQRTDDLVSDSVSHSVDLLVTMSLPCWYWLDSVSAAHQIFIADSVQCARNGFLLKHNFIRFRPHSTCMSIKNISSATELFCNIFKKIYFLRERKREREQFNLGKEWIAHQCYVYLYEILSYFTCMRIRWKYTDVSRYIFL